MGRLAAICAITHRALLDARFGVRHRRGGAFEAEVVRAVACVEVRETRLGSQDGVERTRIDVAVEHEATLGPHGDTLARLAPLAENSTEDYDRIDKFEHYKQIPSLQHYVLVSHRERTIEVWSRADGSWAQLLAREGETASLPALGASIDVRLLYELAARSSQFAAGDGADRVSPTRPSSIP